MKIETFLNELKKCNSLRTRIYLILAGEKRTFTVQFEKNNKGEITSVLLLPYKKIPQNHWNKKGGVEAPIKTGMSDGFSGGSRQFFKVEYII